MATILTRPNAIIIRWRPSGEISGAHVCYYVMAADDQGRPELKPDGSYKLLQEEPAQPIDQASPEMATFFGDVAIQAQAQANALALDKAALTEALRQAQVALQDAGRTIDYLQKQIAALKAPAPSQEPSGAQA